MHHHIYRYFSFNLILCYNALTILNLNVYSIDNELLSAKKGHRHFINCFDFQNRRYRRKIDIFSSLRYFLH